MLSRRETISGLALTGLAFAAVPAFAARSTVQQRLAKLESLRGGKLGVAILDTGTGDIFSNRGHERFPLCSVVKLPTVALVLARVDTGQERLDRQIRYEKDDLVTYSPVTEMHVGSGLSIAELCKAAITTSDNSAQNLLFDSFGGPPALTAYLRSIGDKVTRSDRRETALNDVPLGEDRDTTTPIAMAQLMRRLLAGNALSPESRNQLALWLSETRTGDKRLRAATPGGWMAGDKTGTGPRNATNDVAVFYPPSRWPLIVTAFYIDSPATLEERQTVLAEVGRLAISLETSS